MDDPQQSRPVPEAEPTAGDARVDAVVAGATANRDDVPGDEVRDRARAALADLDEAPVQAFTVPLAVNRVRDELNSEHGPSGSERPTSDEDVPT